MRKELRAEQKLALQKLSNGKILKGGVGSGKTVVAMEYYWANERPKPLYIITTAKKRSTLDWEKEAAAYGISKEHSLAGLLTVDSWNSIKRYADVKDAFFIFDEQRAIGAGTWARTFIKIAKQNNWIILSATPGDTWMDYVPAFVANGFYKNRTEFKREHVIYNSYSRYPKIDRYVGIDRLQRHRRDLLVEMRVVRHTTRHSHIIPVEYDKEMMDAVCKDRWNVYEDRPLKDAGELFRVSRRVTNSHPSRMNEIWRLRNQHQKLLIFYNFNFELDILRSLSEDVLTHEWNGHKHESLPEGDEWCYLVQYTAGAEGWNCITTNQTTMYSLPDSYRNWEQSFGRTDRLDTPFFDLHYNILRSNSITDFRNWKALMEKRNFNMSDMSDLY
jgi:hypothetical protein